jgi:hypothetical protein
VARGSADNPLSQSELSGKFHGLMEAAGLSGRARQIEDLVMNIDAAQSLAPLINAITLPGEPIRRLERAVG